MIQSISDRNLLFSGGVDIGQNLIGDMDNYCALDDGKLSGAHSRDLHILKPCT